MTTDELIAKLMELDPEGNKEIYISMGCYIGSLEAFNFLIDNEGDIIIYSL